MGSPKVLVDLDVFVPDAVLRAGGKDWPVEYMSTRDFFATMKAFGDWQAAESEGRLEDSDVEMMESVVVKSVPSLPEDIVRKFTPKQLMAAIDALLAVQSDSELEDKGKAAGPLDSGAQVGEAEQQASLG